jgi:uncharacterized protein (TIGR03067 family)
MSYCDKSIMRERSYGIPYSVKVEVNMIDLLKSRDDSTRQGFVRAIDELLYSVNSIDSPLLKGEFLQRLLLDKGVPFLKKYIDELYIIFAMQLAPIRENVIYKLIKNLDKANEWEKKIMEDLLKEGLAANPDIDGKWKAVNFTEAGNAIARETGMVLDLKTSRYSFFENDEVVEDGYVFYPPHIQPYTLSLISVWGKNTDSITRGIYQVLENGTLQVCLSQPTKERPVSFLPDGVNHYSLITFSKL